MLFAAAEHLVISTFNEYFHQIDSFINAAYAKLYEQCVEKPYHELYTAIYEKLQQHGYDKFLATPCIQACASCILSDI